MKFSKLEKDVIVDLCNWAQTPNEFQATRDFFSKKGLATGTGLFTFSKEIENRPPTILCIDDNIHKYENFNQIHNQTLFRLFFLRKLERLGLVTISEGRYSDAKEKEYAIGTFADASIIGILKVSEPPEWCYSFTYLKKDQSPCNLELVENGLCIRYKDTKSPLPYFCMEIFSRFDTFDLVASSIALEQELFELVNNGFKTNDEIMLETANSQLETAYDILNNAKIQTTKAIESINQSKIQFEAAQNSAKEQFKTAQDNAYDQFKKAYCNSNIALFLAVISILITPFVAKCVPTTIDEEQYLHADSIRTEELNLLRDIKNQYAKTDTALINNFNKLDTILINKKNRRVNVDKQPNK